MFVAAGLEGTEAACTVPVLGLLGSKCVVK